VPALPNIWTIGTLANSVQLGAFYKPFDFSVILPLRGFGFDPFGAFRVHVNTPTDSDIIKHCNMFPFRLDALGAQWYSAIEEGAVKMVKTISLKAQVTADHQVCITLPEDVPVGPAEIVLVVVPEGISLAHTLGELADSELFGTWKDREDIEDSVEFARKLREEAWKRSA
jgi:hypothetical protein